MREIVFALEPLAVRRIADQPRARVRALEVAHVGATERDAHARALGVRTRLREHALVVIAREDRRCFARGSRGCTRARAQLREYTPLTIVVTRPTLEPEALA